MTWLMQDLRFGLRSIVKDRAFFFTAVLALALGIGSVTVIFTVADSIVLNPFPYTDAQRIYDIEIQDRTSKAAGMRNWFSVPEFLDLQEQNQVFDQSLGVWEESTLLGDPSSPESLDTDLLTGNAFQMLGVPALVGRGLKPEDARPGAAPVFVLSYKLWANRFGGNPTIVGKTFLLNNAPAMLVGIMPKRFTWWGGEIWRPAMVDRARPGNSRFVLYGHLKRGLDRKAAQESIAALLKHMAQVYPDRYPKDFSVKIDTLGNQTIGPFLPMLYLLLGAVGLILLIACANVANLLLVRATTREKEFAIRRALGASRVRLIAQLLSESLLLAACGSIAGCLLAAAGVKGLMAILPIYTFPDEADVSLNPEVLLATVAITFVTAILFGLAPALTTSRRGLSESISSSRGNSSFRQNRLQNSFVVSQVALSLTLLTAAGLLMRTFLLERGVDLGVRTDHLMTTAVALPASSYVKPAAQARFVRELMGRLERVPGVLSAGAAVETPSFGALPTDFDIPGAAHVSAWKGVASPCTSGYFKTIGLRLLAGRVPTVAEENDGRRVAAINETMALHYFGQSAPIGRRIELSAFQNTAKKGVDSWFEVIGVVSDLKNNGVREAVLPEVYLPYTTGDFSNFRVYARTAGSPESMAGAITKQVLLVDRNVVPQETLSMDRILEISAYARPRFGLVLLSTFASMGLLLVVVGVYGVASYSVAQREREVGIRMALGAKPADIRRLVLRNSMSLLLAGVAAGMVLTFFATRLLANQIWGVSAHDPMTFGAVVMLLAAVGFVASWLPSRRASRVDPAICLRAE
ncbi:MAG TPA: ABC transporter permease [Bryobacteraceae bacterium]|jgi:predicted permease|nr:ABC transporter permease [Bryobacteraceae bacterium]